MTTPPSTSTTAARLHEHGQALRVEQVPLAEPGAGEVLVRLAFAGVNPVERYAALGRVAADVPLPRTLGNEGAGTLDGARVAVTGGGIGSQRDGTWAGAVVAPRQAVIAVPGGLGLREAACCGVAGLTAWSTVVERARVTDADTVLVLGAGGGVGLPIVSLAHGLGARVLGQIGTAAKAEAVRAAGADDVVTADAEGLAAAVGSLTPTVVVDPLGGGFAPAAIGLLAAHGRYVVYGTTAGAEVTLDWQQVYRQGLTVLGYSGMVLADDERARLLPLVLDALSTGAMRMPIDTVLPLAEVDDALQRLAGRGITGKLVLDVG